VLDEAQIQRFLTFKKYSMNLRLQYVSPYFPYQLNVKDLSTNQIGELFSISIGKYEQNTFVELHLLSGGRILNFKDCELMLRPLSNYSDINAEAMIDLNCDVSTQIELNEFAIGYTSLNGLTYSTYILCLKNHIDIFGLIEKGLAVPIKDETK
jgi:hypothetical protein